MSCDQICHKNAKRIWKISYYVGAKHKLFTNICYYAKLMIYHAKDNALHDYCVKCLDKLEAKQ